VTNVVPLGLVKPVYTDTVVALRNIADGIEQGLYGDVRCIALVVKSTESVEVFGCGPEAENDDICVAVLARGLKAMT